MKIIQEPIIICMCIIEIAATFSLVALFFCQFSCQAHFYVCKQTTKFFSIAALFQTIHSGISCVFSENQLIYRWWWWWCICSNKSSQNHTWINLHKTSHDNEISQHLSFVEKNISKRKGTMSRKRGISIWHWIVMARQFTNTFKLLQINKEMEW